ncbi:hypothetical protein ACNVED_07450 [Legionella sp. D16C41]
MNDVYLLLWLMRQASADITARDLLSFAKTTLSTTTISSTSTTTVA